MLVESTIKKLVDRMTSDQRAEYERGCKLVDYYMDLASDKGATDAERSAARDKLRKCALRDVDQSVMDVIGKPILKRVK